MDSVNLVTMLLLDKGYFDYDYVAKEEEQKQIMWEDTVKSDEEAAGIAAMFGIGVKKEKPQTEEEIQQYILNQEGGQ